LSARHDHEPKVISYIRRTGLLVALLVLITMPKRAEAVDQVLLLDLRINGHSVHKVGEFTLHDGVLLSRRSELQALGIRVPAPHDASSDSMVALSSLRGLTYRIDQKTQTLYVRIPNSGLLPTVLQVNSREQPAGPRVFESGTGVTLNYDIIGTLAGGHNGASGSLDLRAFSPEGVASSGFLIHTGATPNASSKKRLIRLDSTYEFADASTLRRYSVGDFITGSLSWTRPVRLAGVQIRSDFSMRPDLVTFPLPSIRGAAAVHSVVDVLTNGNQVLSQEIDPGPFVVPQLPMVTGEGTISMTVTNPLGQEMNVTQRFYASSELLATGLQTFSAQIGAVRRNWGVISNDYGTFAGLGNYRRGLSSNFTVETNMEATRGKILAGGGFVANLANFAAVNLAVAGSSGSGHAGGQISLGAQRIGRRFSLGASAIIAGRQFADVAAMNGDPVPSQQVNASLGLSLKTLGSIGIAYIGRNVEPPAYPVAPSITPLQRSQILSATYSFQVHHMSAYATEFHDYSNQTNNGFMIGLTIPFGSRSSATLSTGSANGYGQVQVQQPASRIGDWGYQAYVSAANPDHEYAQAQYKSPWGLLSAGVDHNGAATTVNLESQAAVSFVDKGLFPSNTIYDSFAIVDTAPIAHVHVLQENRDVGTTNSAGRLLVPDMRSFDLNHIAIVPTDIPPDATVDVASREVRPRDSSGVVIRLPIKISHGALLRLVDEGGLPIPLGSTARLRSTGAVAPVGYDGDAYVENLNPYDQVEVERPNGQRCSVTFGYKPVPNEIPTIGPLRCTEQKP
jgi:outer membrane usher protein